MDNLYDKIGEIEDAIQDVTAKINAAYGEHLTAQELYKVLENFDDIYFKMSDLEKKEFYQNFIESITIYPDKKTNERIIDEIDFKFPIYYDGQEGRAIRLLNKQQSGPYVSCTGRVISAPYEPKEANYLK